MRPRRRKRTIRFLKLTSVLGLGILTVSASVGVSLGSLELRTEPGPASDSSTPALDSTLPDPFARPSTSLVSVAVVGFLLIIAVGALWLGRRQSPELEEEVASPPSGPRVVMADGTKGRRRPPRFYEDLRHRETVLENLGERGPDRPRPKIIELPVADHRSPEGDG